VAVLALAATFDAVRGKGSRAEPRRPAPAAEVRIPHRGATARALRAAGISGTLYYTRPDCRIRALRLPGLEPVPAPAPGATVCSMAVSPVGLKTQSWALWRGPGPLVAFCDGGHVAVAALDGRTLPVIGGCSPAWRRDGSLSYVRRGSVVQFPPHGRAEVLLRRSEVAAALGRHDLPSVEELAWLGDSRFAATVSSGRADVLTLFDHGRLARWTAFPGAPLFGLQASPRGDRLALLIGQGRLMLLDGRLRPVPLPRPLRTAHALTWSPGEGWTVGATDSSVVFVHPGRRPLAIGLQAMDVAWR